VASAAHRRRPCREASPSAVPTISTPERLSITRAEHRSPTWSSATSSNVILGYGSRNAVPLRSLTRKLSLAPACSIVYRAWIPGQSRAKRAAFGHHPQQSAYLPRTAPSYRSASAP
jgi:hypothetical protein